MNIPYENFFKQIKMDPLLAKVDQVTLFSAYAKTGDYILTFARLAPHLQKLCPDKKIEFISSQSRFFQNQKNISFTQQDFAQLMSPKIFSEILDSSKISFKPSSALFKFSKKYIARVCSLQKTNHFFIYQPSVFALLLRHSAYYDDRHHTDFEKRKFKRVAVYIENQLKDIFSKGTGPVWWYSWEMAPVLFLPKNSLQAKQYQKFEKYTKKGLPARSSIYEEMAPLARMYFGAKNIPLLPAKMLKPAPPRKDFNQLLSSQWSDCNRDFILLHLETAERWKAVVVGQEAFAVTSFLVQELFKKFPEINLLLTPFEDPPGLSKDLKNKLEKDRKQIKKFLSQKKYRGRIAILPDDKYFWPAAKVYARYVIARDSGLVHIANIYRKSAKTVLTFAHNTAVFFWSMPNQPKLANFTTAGSMKLNTPEFHKCLDQLAKNS